MDVASLQQLKIRADFEHDERAENRRYKVIMAVSELSSHALVEQYGRDKSNPELHEEITRRMINPDQSDKVFRALSDVFETGASLSDEEHLPISDAEAAAKRPPQQPEWHNCIGQQKCNPKILRNVSSLQDLIAAVKEGAAKKLPVRAVGSGHSFSDVCPTTGILLDPHGMSKFLKVDGSTLKNPEAKANLVSVESGITIADLNTGLNRSKPSMALATMGAYDGQTLAGAISTGTHGSGVTLGPLASLVCSVVFVSESGTVYQVEPSDGVTDPAKFQPGKDNLVLKQDDSWFNCALVAMGCIGLVYSYTLNVVDAFFLEENRTVTTWQDFKPQLVDGLLSAPLQHRYFEIDINPYVTNGKNVAVTVIRDIPPPDRKAPDGSRGADNWLSGLLAAWPAAERLVVGLLNMDPKLSPGIITRALKTLADHGYVRQSYVVLNLGTANKVKAYAMEFSFDANQDIVATVDSIIAAFDAATKENMYLAGPFSCRFVASSPAYVAPQEGRISMMVEMDMLDGIKKGPDLLKFMKRTLCSNTEGVRIHWGLDLDTVTKDEVARMFPQWNNWVSVYKQLNTSGIWNSPFTDRLGISVAPK